MIEYRGEKFSGYNKPKRIARSPRKGERQHKTHPFRPTRRLRFPRQSRRIGIGQSPPGILRHAKNIAKG
jgi:hypothetical protein